MQSVVIVGGIYTQSRTGGEKYNPRGKWLTADVTVPVDSIKSQGEALLRILLSVRQCITGTNRLVCDASNKRVEV